MYKLYFSTKDFKPNGISKEKVPLLIKKETMEFEEIPTLWFFDLAINSGKTPSPETWRGYAEAILDFFNTCETNGWNWKIVTKEHLVAYRNNMLNIKTVFNRPYTKSTINNYLTRVCLFYEWCYKKNYIKKLPFEKEFIKVHKNIKDNFFMGHLNNQNNSIRNELTLKQTHQTPKCLTKDEFNTILSHLAERDILLVKWSVLTGMRKKEVLSLKLKDIPSSQENNPIIKINISITKGSKPRDILVPQSLIDETNKYIKFTRRFISKKYNTLNIVNDLWISSRTGLPIGKKTIEKNFRNAVKQSGINCTFHHLRHTYAIKMLSVLTKQTQNNGLNPLKTLQMLLGHSNINTTMIYLEALRVDLNEIEISLKNFYGDLLDEKTV